ncbi:hypothetical protein BG015_004290 [Linnemannia schmuckeri]|uniref:C2H2-type domain-containing protein n=1 Tax=Linnemannia schmuckeri TaxID=64567 RepID=A0A9P5S5F8_9FUNG|nr:hypothetical protein BG015_004290 [Linnemannia schmuckeri]
MNSKPLEGYIHTTLSNKGEIFDNLSSFSAWPSYDGTDGFVAPSVPKKQQQQQQQQDGFGFMTNTKQEHQVHPFEVIYTANSLSPPFDSTATSFDNSINSSPSHADYPSNNTFGNFDSCYISKINDPIDNKDIEDTIDFNGLFDHTDTSYKHDANIGSAQKNDMEFIMTTYITKSAAALNVNNPSPSSIHPYLTMRRSSSFTSAVSYIDPALLIRKNNNSDSNDTSSGCATDSNFSTSQTSCLSSFPNGGLDSENDSYATMRTMFENSLRMGSPEFGSCSSDHFKFLPPSSSFSIASAATATASTPGTSLHANPLTSQDIYMADGSVICFDGASFRPVPSTTTTVTTAVMDNAHISSGLTMAEPTLSLSPSMIMMSTHKDMTAAASTDATTAYYGLTSLSPFSYHQRFPLINDSFKTYNKSPYHKHPPRDSAASTTDSAAFAAALLSPQLDRRGSADSSCSTASIAYRRSKRLIDSHSRHSSATSFKDFDDRNHKRSSISLSYSLSSSLPSASSLSTFAPNASSSCDSPSMLPPSSNPSSLSLTPSIKYRKDKNGEFQCPYTGCDYRYNLKREFNRHRNVHVFAGKDKYRCMNCGSGLCRLDSVKRHMEAKGKAECLRKGFYEEFHESGQYSLIRKCKSTWYEAAAAARTTSLKGKVKA